MTQGSPQHGLRGTLLEDLRVLRQLEGVIDRLDNFEAEAPQKRLSLGAMARRLEKRLDRFRPLSRG